MAQNYNITLTMPSGDVGFPTTTEEQVKTKTSNLSQELKVINEKLDERVIHNTNAVNDPSTETLGSRDYGVGSLWINIISGAFFVCIDKIDDTLTWTKLGRLVKD